MKLSFLRGGDSLRSQDVGPGVLQVTGPGQSAKVTNHGPCDVLHLYVQTGLLRECAEWRRGEPRRDIVMRDPWFSHDPVIERLGRSLLSVDETGGAFASLYADTLSLAIVARLLNLCGECLEPLSNRRVSPLAKWRLKRTIEFIEANLDDTITLADLARAAGLTRMHFAAQFRLATGLRPHDYVLWHRVEKAKKLLRTSDSPIVQVALATGFHAQPHFTQVFKRFTGLPPNRWRSGGHAAEERALIEPEFA
jgi:AraC-like DNA-binding protein